MSTSGEVLSTITAKEVIQEALELLGVLGEGELANSDQETSLLRTLNTMAVTWQAAGINLFAVQNLFMFLNRGQYRYLFGPNSSTDITRAGEIITKSYLAESAGEGDTLITLTEPLPSYTEVAVSEIGIMTTTGDMHWSTISAINDEEISLTTALPGPANVGALCYSYKENKAVRKPMKVLEGYHVSESGTSIPMSQISRMEYDSLSRKDSVGVPLQFFYDPKSTDAILYVWPTTASESDMLQLRVQRQLDTNVNLTDDIEFPAEWFLPLSTNLAMVSSAKHGTPQFDYYRIRELAQKYYDIANEFDVEWGTSMYLSPDDRGSC